jgi:predicted deacetylase
MNPQLLSVILHDVAPATLPGCERVLRCLGEIAPLPVTLLAVPCYHGQRATPALEEWLDEANAHGDELALHGYMHRDDGRPRGLVDHALRRWYTAGEGEFAAISVTEARERLQAGRQWFLSRRWPLHGFVAPAWLMNAPTFRLVRDLGFEYTCTLTRVVSMRERRSLSSPSLVYSTRAAWRRALSLPWNEALARLSDTRPLLRLELHPADADHRGVRRSWMHLLERALARRRVATLHDALSELTPMPSGPARW